MDDFAEQLVTEKTSIGLGSLVLLEQDDIKQHWFFIAPVAGGYRCQIPHKNTLVNITVITPESPMGAALLGKQLDDEVRITIASNTTYSFIINVQ